MNLRSLEINKEKIQKHIDFKCKRKAFEETKENSKLEFYNYPHVPLNQEQADTLNYKLSKYYSTSIIQYKNKNYPLILFTRSIADQETAKSLKLLAVASKDICELSYRSLYYLLHEVSFGILVDKTMVSLQRSDFTTIPHQRGEFLIHQLDTYVNDAQIILKKKE
jgi:hypothetical protein